MDKTIELLSQQALDTAWYHGYWTATAIFVGFYVIGRVIGKMVYHGTKD